MNITVKGKVFRVKWTHIREDESTFCKILNEDGGTVCSGMSLCHPKDQFNKATGRKTSLMKALLSSAFSKGEREQFWSEYLTKFPLVR